MFTVNMKSGTGGYYDPENRDAFIAEVPSENIPAVGDILYLGDEDNLNLIPYLVREVRREYQLPNDRVGFGEWFSVYVIYA